MELEDRLREYANRYNTKDFIKDDPIQFPRKLYDEGARIEDIEISAIISSWLAYGSRGQFLPKLHMIHDLMGWEPYEYIKSEEWNKFNKSNDVLYRFYKWTDFCELCCQLYVYYDLLEMIIAEEIAYTQDPLMKLIIFFLGIKGFPIDNSSACKRLNMLLRWMGRDDGIVDMGLWKVDKSKLIIPLDTHVHRIALELGITKRNIPDMKTAIEITDYFKAIFPDDPAKGDFALYGLGIDKKNIG